MENNQSLFGRIVNDPEFGDILKGMIMGQAYQRQRSTEFGAPRYERQECRRQ
jgi:single-stranded DNA-binding protein